MVLYVAKDQIDWYNENGLHDQVLKELYPVILNYVVTEQDLPANKRQKDAETNRVIYSKLCSPCAKRHHWLILFDSGWLSYFIQICGTKYAANLDQISRNSI